jgi:hypothetical protein
MAWPDQEDYYRHTTSKNLEQHAQKHGWADVPRSALLKSLIMVCTRPETKDTAEVKAAHEDKYPKMQSGYWVMKGVMYFLGADGEPVFEKNGGFMVDHRGEPRNVEYLDKPVEDLVYGATGFQKRYMRKYELVHEKKNETDDWTIVGPDHVSGG